MISYEALESTEVMKWFVHFFSLNMLGFYTNIAVRIVPRNSKLSTTSTGSGTTDTTKSYLVQIIMSLVIQTLISDVLILQLPIYVLKLPKILKHRFLYWQNSTGERSLFIIPLTVSVIGRKNIFYTLN